MRTELSEVGCSVRGVDAAAISATDLQALRQLLYASRLIVLKSQHLSDLQYCEFAKSFANPVVNEPSQARHPEHPLILVTSGGTDPRDGWHAHASYERVPKVITMMMPKQQAASAHFIDMAEVHAALPAALKERLKGAMLVHAPMPEGANALELGVRHPAVIVHPCTRERILYANSRFTVGIADAPRADAALLRDVLAFAESDRFVRSMRWSEGDIVIWDNRFLQHRPDLGAGQGQSGSLYRICGRDAYPLCATQLSDRAAA